MTKSCALMINLITVFTLTEKTLGQTFLELASILTIKLHASPQKRILGLSDKGLPVGISRNSVVTRDALLQLYQVAVSIITAGRRTELTSPRTHGIIHQMNGTSHIVQQSPSLFQTQRGSKKKRTDPVTKIDPQI